MKLVLKALFLVLFLCGSGVAGPYDAWTEPGVEVTFTGTGLESGHVLDMRVRNNGKSPVTFQLPQLTVLDSTSMTPVLVESKGGWEIPPGVEISHAVMGYSLEQAKPAQVVSSPKGVFVQEEVVRPRVPSNQLLDV